MSNEVLEKEIIFLKKENEKLKNKLGGIVEPGKDDSKGSAKGGKRGIIGKLGAFVYSHWLGSAIISPIVFIICLCLLFSIRGKGGNDD